MYIWNVFIICYVFKQNFRLHDLLQQLVKKQVLFDFAKYAVLNVSD